MGQNRITTKTVELAAAAAGPPIVPTVGYVWDEPFSSAFQNVNIWVSSNGMEFAAGDIEWEVMYCTKWSGGAPFGSASTPVAGIVQSTGLFACPTEIFEHVYLDTDMLPPNKRVVFQGVNPPVDLTGFGGAAVVLKVSNYITTVPIKLTVTFASEEVTDIR